MIDPAYLQRAAQDLYMRASTIVLNNVTVPIRSVKQEGSRVIITAASTKGVSQVTSLKLLDESGGLITERKVDLCVPDQLTVDFRFEFEVTGGTE